MTTALLADDESLLRDDLRDKLAALWPELEIVAEATNGNEAAALIAEYAPDIVFLDIKMPGQTGIEVAQGIETDSRIVFVTAYDQFAVDAFEREAIDYLLKPVTRKRLAQTVARLKHAVAQPAAPASQAAPELAHLLNLLSRAGIAAPAGAAAKPPLRWIRASRGDTTYQIAVDEVLYFQSDDKYTIVYTANGDHVIRMPLAELVASLDAETFWQVHRGTIVNIRNVLSSKRDGDGRLSLNIKGVAKPLTVSRAYQHLFKQM
ncbi:MAG: response regulator transcription factor [Burkholderiales bacterium]|nr:response regulator transcription factor [Burkholderiales bacterium]